MVNVKNEVIDAKKLVSQLRNPRLELEEIMSVLNCYTQNPENAYLIEAEAERLLGSIPIETIVNEFPYLNEQGYQGHENTIQEYSPIPQSIKTFAAIAALIYYEGYPLIHGNNDLIPGKYSLVIFTDSFETVGSEYTGKGTKEEKLRRNFLRLLSLVERVGESEYFPESTHEFQLFINSPGNKIPPYSNL